jgi:POT family proton-dependent oligopeptide transporter
LPLMRKLSREHQRCGDEARENARQAAALSGAVAE